MRKILFIAFTSIAVAASAQTWNSAFNAGGANSQHGIGSARDAASARIVVGTYGSTNSIGAGPAVFGTATLANAGSLDGYVVKYNASNAFLWAARISGPNSDIVKSVTTDESNNIYVCGTFSGSATFYNASGGGSYTTLTASTTAMYDGFIVKYNSSGVIQWVVRPVTTTATYDDAVNIEYRNSTLAVLGNVHANASTGSFSLFAGHYLAKIDPSSGSVIWAYTCTPSSNWTSPSSYKPGLCIDNTGNIYVTANGMNGTAYGLSSSIALSTNANAAPAYAKYSNTGNILWAKICQTSIGGLAVGRANSITVDDNNNLYIGGRLPNYAGTLSMLFPTASGSISVGANADNACYIGKIDAANGNALWMTRQVSFEWTDLVAVNCGFMYATLTTTPNIASSVTINGTGGTTYTATTNGLHVVQFSSTGQLISTVPWHISQGGWASAAYLDYHNGSVDVVGTIRGASTVPLTSGGTTTLTSNYDDMLAGTLKASSISGALINASASSSVICNGDYASLSASAVGPGAPFTFSWLVYKPSTGTYIPATGTIFNPPNGSILDQMPAEYAPYIYDFFGIKYCLYKVVITDCSGATTERDIFFEVRNPITYGQVQSQTICHNGNPPSPVFSVSAPNAIGYRWEFRAAGTLAWVNCSTNPTLYSGYNTALLTVNSPGLSMDGCQFRCILQGYSPCPDITTTPATLNVVPTCLKDPGVKGKTALLPDNEDIQVYPNPTSGQVTINLGSLEGVEGFELTVLNMEGRVIAQEKIKDVQTELDLSMFENGVYMYTITGKDATFNGKIILTH